MTAFTFAPDGRCFAAHAAAARIVELAATGDAQRAITGLTATGLAAGSTGELYAVEAATGRLWLLTPDGTRRALSHPAAALHRVAFAAGGSQLILTEAGAPCAWQGSVLADGTVAHLEPVYRFAIPEGLPAQSPGDLATHPKRWSFFVTTHGLQLADHDGRILGLFDPPAAGALEGVALGGATPTSLFVTCGGKIYHRPLRNPEHLWQ